VSLLLELSERRPLVFVLHPPTEARLERLGLLSRLRGHERIRLLPLLPHNEFVHLLQGADFVVTDGGSVQEECASLGKPCLLMRSATERRDGLGASVRLSGLSRTAVGEFVDCLETLEAPGVPQAGDPGARSSALRPSGEPGILRTALCDDQRRRRPRRQRPLCAASIRAHPGGIARRSRGDRRRRRHRRHRT
jgi:hypothetical protein